MQRNRRIPDEPMEINLYSRVLSIFILLAFCLQAIRKMPHSSNSSQLIFLHPVDVWLEQMKHQDVLCWSKPTDFKEALMLHEASSVLHLQQLIPSDTLKIMQKVWTPLQSFI